MNGYELYFKGDATFTSGTVQNGNLTSHNRKVLFNGTNFNCNINLYTGQCNFNGGTFSLPVTVQDTGFNHSVGNGNCTFQDSLIINHYGDNNFRLGAISGDIYNGPVIATNYSSGFIDISYTDTSYFNDAIIINNTGGGIRFGASSGISYFEAGSSLNIGSVGFTDEYLILTRIFQNVDVNITINLTGTAITSMELCQFIGDVVVSAPAYLLKNNEFYGVASFTRTGTAIADNYGGNVYHSTFTASNQSASGRLRLATTAGDTYLNDVVFNSTGNDVNVAYKGDNYFEGDISINHRKIVFNASTGWVHIAGPNAQQFNAGTDTLKFGRLRLNKSGNDIESTSSIEIQDTLQFQDGVLSINNGKLITFRRDAVSLFAGDASYVDGLVEKEGNTSFIFPIGSGNFCMPISMTAPSNVTHKFAATYFNTGQHSGENIDSSLAGVKDCNHWQFLRTLGNSNVSIILTWRNEFCPILDTAYLKIVSWYSNNWNDLGHGLITGNYSFGNMQTLTSLSNFGYFAFAYDTTILNESNPEEYSLSSGFVENAGQLYGLDTLQHPEILYYGGFANSLLYMSDEEFYFAYASYKTDTVRQEEIVDSVLRVEMVFSGNNHSTITAYDSTQGTRNFHYGDSTYAGLYSYQFVNYDDFYNDMDLQFYNSGELRFMLGGTANITDIEFQFDGEDSIDVNSANLKIYNKFNYQNFDLYAYQFDDYDQWIPIDANFATEDDIVLIEIGTTNLMLGLCLK